MEYVIEIKHEIPKTADSYGSTVTDFALRVSSTLPDDKRIAEMITAIVQIATSENLSDKYNTGLNQAMCE